MASTSTARARLTDEELSRMLALMKGSDSVELKATVPESAHRSSIASLGIDPLEAQIRQVFFFDTPDLAVSGSGVVVRARRVQGKGDDSVVKLRPVVPDDLSDDLRRSAGFFVEVDAMPGGFVCSASLRGTPRKADIRATVADGLPRAKAVLPGAARVLRRTRARGHRPRRPHRPRPDLHPEGPVDAQGARPPQARRRDVALPRRLAPPGALDEMPAG